VGPLVGGPQPDQLIQINDPQAGVTFMLDTRNRTAHKLTMPKIARAQFPTRPPAGGVGTFELPLPPPPPLPPPGSHDEVFFRSVVSGLEPPAIERLGKQII